MTEKKGIIRIIGDTLAYLTGKGGKVESSEKLEISQKTERKEKEKERKDD